MKLLPFLLVLLSLISMAQSRPEDCISKLKSGWGPVAGCKSEDSYHVVLKSSCSSPVDMVCGIQERSGEWKVFRKNSLVPGDTMLAFGCDGSGKFQYWVRFSGDTSHLPTYEELNPNLAKSNTNVFDLFAKLLYGEFKKEPLKNQRVELLNSKGETVQSSVTDQYGDFVFHKLSNSERYEVFVGDVNISKDEKLFIARQNGAILSELKLVKDKNYKYSFLPSDIVTLSLVEVEDPALALEVFKKGNKEKLSLRQEIYYTSGSIIPSDSAKLDMILNFLKENPHFNLQVLSHTDSRGDDKQNLQLSQKRSDYVKSYLLRKGINSGRVSSKGEGERFILNRCLNGIECSEKEHGMNRRTEFIFTKSK